MPTMKLRLGSTLAVVALFVSACGSAPAKEPTPTGGAEGSGEPDVVVKSTQLPPPLPSDAQSSAPPPEPPPPPSASASAPPPPIVSSGGSDECTPVGVDFEKRARPKLKECYQTGKKKDPNLEGTVKIKITVDVKGKIKAVKVIEKTLPDPVADCMLKVVKATPFPEVDKCWDSTITIPITFPTPR